MKGLTCWAMATLIGWAGVCAPAASYAADPAAGQAQAGDSKQAPAKQAPAGPNAAKSDQQQQPPGVQKRAKEPTAFVLIVPVPVARPVASLPDSVLAPDVEQIRDTLASATEAALTRGGFDDLMERFVDADRNRMGRTRLDDLNLDVLDGRVAELRKAWKDKYGSEFDINDEAKVFGPFPVVQGEVADHPRLAAGKLGPADRIAGNGPEDVNLEPGRDVALLSVPRGHGQPELSVLLVHEFPDSWRIDVPDRVSASNLYDNLIKHLDYLNAHASEWPATKAEAYRVVSHHVLAAVMGYDAKPGQPE